MLKSKLGLKNKDKDTNSQNNVNSKETSGHNKSRVKKLLNGKGNGHNILSINNIKPVKPKGSVYDLSNGIEGEKKSKIEDDIDDTTLTSSSPQTLEPIDKDKFNMKTMEKQDLNSLNDTQSSPDLQWATAVAPNASAGKGIPNATFDSVNTLNFTTSSSINSPKSSPASLTNLNTNIPSHQKINSPKMKSSPFLAPPKSPLEVFTKLSHLKSSDNASPASAKSGNYLSVPNLVTKTSSTSLNSPVSPSGVTSSADSGLNKLSKKLAAKKEKKENGNSASKKPSSLFSSLGKYIKNKATDIMKDKEGKKAKEKQEVDDEDNQEVEEIRVREVATLIEEGKEEMEMTMDTFKMKQTELDKGEIIKIADHQDLTTPVLKEAANDGEKKIVTAEPKGSGDNGSSSSQHSETLVEPNTIESATTTASQPISIVHDTTSSLQIIDQNMRITASPTSSLPPIPPTGNGRDNLTSEGTTTTTTEEENGDREGTYRQSTYKCDKNDEASFFDNEDTIIKKSSCVSTSNKRQSTRDINFCHELRLAGALDGGRNSLSIESTITELKRQSALSISDESSNVLKSLAEDVEPKPTEMPKSPLANAVHTIKSFDPLSGTASSTHEESKGNKKNLFIYLKINLIQ
ncbi:hypothetical protein PIROE2DRAFT_14369 [Piromyces sp. E2]|nr:hypothetical protein PIROE2DRAFT_14369 [Piromyces sp. E2]|eukprot:OUM59959.1 hypothetical protein PIROE2DRAFT_14369 [Piromyces sp. E2]